MGNHLSWSNSTFILTGATGGIGQAIAKRLRQQGAGLILVARRREGLEALRDELQPLKTQSSLPIVVCDADITLSSDQDRIAVYGQQYQANGLINNAAVPAFDLLEDWQPEQIASNLQSNLIAPIQLTKHLLPLLLEQSRSRAGHVVNIASMLAYLGAPGFSVYCASKFGLRGFTEALRREYAQSTIRFQLLAPRATKTSFNDQRVLSLQKKSGASIDTPEAVANALIHLLTSGKAEYRMGGQERLAALLSGLCPTWLDGVFRGHASWIRQFKVSLNDK